MTINLPFKAIGKVLYHILWVLLAVDLLAELQHISDRLMLFNDNFVQFAVRLLIGTGGHTS
jgi:hypothetical protein